MNPEIRGASDLLARADTVFQLYITKSNLAPTRFKYVLDVLKSRSHSPSRHGFQTAKDLLDFMNGAL